MDHDSPNLGGSILYLLFNFVLGMIYFPLLAAAYATAGVLTTVLIGLPMLSLLFSLTRAVAMFDYRLGALFLGLRAPDHHPVDLEKAGLYMFSKFPLGIASIVLLAVGFPFVILEFVALAPFGITRGRALAHLLRALALMMYDFKGGLLGIKRDPILQERDSLRREREALARERESAAQERQALQREREWAAQKRMALYDDDERYELDDDGEIVPVKRKR